MQFIVPPPKPIKMFDVVWSQSTLQLLLFNKTAGLPCLEDGPGRDHDDEGQGDGREGPQEAGQSVRLLAQSDWSPGGLAAQQHWQSSAESGPAKYPSYQSASRYSLMQLRRLKSVS